MKTLSHLFIVSSLMPGLWTGVSGEAAPSQSSPLHVGGEVASGIEESDSLRELVHLYLQLREYDRARFLLEQWDLPATGDTSLGRIWLLAGHYGEALESLKGVGHPFQVGYCYERLGEPKEAILYYQEAVQEDPLLGDYCLFRIGTCKLSAGDYGGAIKTMREVGEMPLSLLVPLSYEKAAESYEAMGEVRRGGWLRRVAGKRWPAESSKMKWERAQLLEREGRPREAAKLYYRLIRHSPGSEFSSSAVQRLKALTTVAAADLLYTGRVYYYGRLYREAAQDLASHLAAHPHGANSKEAHYLLGRSLYRSGDCQGALDHFQCVLDGYRKDGLFLRSLFNLATCQDRVGARDLAICSFQRLVADFPHSYLADDALYQLGRFYEKRGDLDRAAAAYRRAVETGGDYSYRALLRIGLIELRAEDFDSAAERFRELVRCRGDLGEAATYWLARSLESGGHAEEARELYLAIGFKIMPSFYSLLSRERLNLSGELPLIELAQVTPEEWIASWPTSLSSSPEDSFRLCRGEKLVRLGFLRGGSEELNLVRSWNPPISYLTASLFRDGGSDNEAIRYGSRVVWGAVGQGRTDLPEPLVRILYPTPYWLTVKQWSDSLGLDPLLVLALIREESRFDADAVSRAGAVGLTQVICQTGMEIAHQLGDRDFKVENLHNPQKSIQYGSFYLSQLLNDFGRADFALAAYNGGPDRVAEWIEDDPDPEVEWFIEEIPFRETRQYVKRVLSSLWVYRLLYRKEQQTHE